MADLKHKAVLSNFEKKQIVYRIQGGVWLRYVQSVDAYYLSVPQEVAEAINTELEKVDLKKYLLEIKPQEVNGKVYTNVSFGIKLYELKDTIGAKGHTLLADCAIRFSEYNFNNRKGLSKTLLQAVIAPTKRDWLGEDDYFKAAEGETQQADVEPIDDVDVPF